MAEKIFKEPEGIKPTFFTRLNDFILKHAKRIIFVSSVLIVIMVLVLAYFIWKKVRMDKAIELLDTTASTAELEMMRKKYNDLPVYPNILFKLANLYYEHGEYQKAKPLYEEITKKYEGHFIHQLASTAYNSLLTNTKFLEDEKHTITKKYTLLSHPRLRDLSIDNTFKFIPKREINPQVTFNTTKGRFKIELFEDLAPNTVANFIKMCEEKNFDSLKLLAVSDGQVLKLEEKQDQVYLESEKTYVAVDAGSILCVQESNLNKAGTFLIALKSFSSEATLFGEVTEGMEDVVKKITDQDSIKDITVDKKRDHNYEPRIIQK